jgi:hypothetical protein
VGRYADGFFSAGLGAAYLAIGAPSFAQIAPTGGSLSIAMLSEENDEHDIKLVYACQALARTTGDPSYEWAARRYLQARLSGRVP